MKKSLFRWVFALSVLALPVFTFATAEMSEKAVAVEPPMTMTPKTYKFDTKAALEMFKNKTSTLQQITCPRDVLIRQAGLVGTNKNWTTVSYEDPVSKMYITYDMQGCNFNGYSSDISYGTVKYDPITDAAALAKAKEFLSSPMLKDLITTNLGEPIIVNKYSANGGIMPMPIDSREAPANNDYIDADEFTHISIVFPYEINGKRVYSNYGGRAGISVEVTSRWITSYYGQLIALGDVKNAKPMLSTQFVSYIKRGWNNPYRGNESTVNLGAGERVYTIINDWRNGKNTNYLATATLFSSDIPLADYQPWQNYEMMISDYLIGNPNISARMY